MVKYRLIDKKHVEVVQQTNSLQNELIEQAIRVMEGLEKGDFNEKVKRQREHPLSAALLSLQSHFKQMAAKEEEKKWVNEGLAHFIELIRSNNEDLHTKSDKILSYLVRYLNANQGAFFLLNEQTNHSFLELTACYAYNRKKHQTKRIEIGQGLIGQAYLEGSPIYMTQVPDRYTTITSGLGESTPSCILILPLKSNEKVMGVIEFASFIEFAPYQIDFLERLGETIASHISMARITSHTSDLMKEYRQQAEELKAQEETMKQNMEELIASQESQNRLQEELQERLQELETAKQEVERIKTMEAERTKRQNEVQKNIMQSTIEKFKKRERELLEELERAKAELASQSRTQLTSVL